MRRILITPEILEHAEKYSNDLFKTRKGNFIKPISDVDSTGLLYDLEKYLRKDLRKINYANYVLAIINNYKEINSLPPVNFKSYHAKYFNLSKADLGSKIPEKDNPSVKTELHKQIVKAMRFDAVREVEILPYIKKLGIKTCVYCNSQFAITTEKNDGVLSGKYEIDHFLSKSEYPFLCTSFFNLYPCCSSCNKSKGIEKAAFNLYTEDYSKLDMFSFSLDVKSMLKYLLTQDADVLRIKFNSIDKELIKSHEKLFHISELYMQHKDIVEEIIWKAKIYNESYKNVLKTSFPKFFPGINYINRFILGNYDEKHEIHKRPLSKLIQDIAKQLEIF